MVEADLPHDFGGGARDSVAARLVPGEARAVDKRHIANAAKAERIRGGGTSRPRADDRNPEASISHRRTIAPACLTSLPGRLKGSAPLPRPALRCYYRPARAMTAMADETCPTEDAQMAAMTDRIAMAARVVGVGLAFAFAPVHAQAGETVDYVIGGETFEGYRAAASGASKVSFSSSTIGTASRITSSAAPT